VVAAETLKFLENNQSYAPIVMHGFSVGAYQMGEIMLQMSRDMDRYSSILDRVACQIWDSAADITEIPVGLPKSIFPKNERMQSALRNYTLYHMKTFHNQATIHYMRSSQMFHSTLLKAPAQLFSHHFAIMYLIIEITVLLIFLYMLLKIYRRIKIVSFIFENLTKV